MMTRFVLTLLIGLVVSLGALVSGGPLLAKDYGGTLSFLIQPEPPNLASYLSTSGPIGLIMPKIYEGLFDYDNDGKLIPILAESYEMSADGRTVQFNLRKGVAWHDGKPFTSADVKFTVMNVLKKFHPRGPNSFREVARIETPDAHTAIFKLKKPAPYMMRSFSGYESPMVPKHLLEGKNLESAPLANKPIGTGPFKFVTWKRGQYILLVKNEDYWQKGLPYLDKIIGRFIPDASSRTAAMANGEVLYAAYNAIPNIDAVRLKDRKDIDVTTDGYSMINPMALIEFNTKEGPFVDPAIRRAISVAIDRRFMIDTIFFGYGRPATSALSSSFKATNLHADMPNYPERGDKAAANAILDKAGYKRNRDGVRLKAVLDIIPYGSDWRRVGEYLQKDLDDIGIQLELRVEDVPTWLERVYHRYDFQMNVNYFYQLQDPVLGVHRHYGTDQIRKGWHFVNSSRYSNFKLDYLLDSGANKTNSMQRSKAYREIQQVLADDMPVVNLFELEFLVVHNTKLKGAFNSAMGPYSSFREAWLGEAKGKRIVSASTSKPKVTSAALTTAEKEAERLRQELAALKAQQQQQQQTISSDTKLPTIAIASASTKGKQGIIRGNARDNTGIAEVTVSGKSVPFDTLGNFKFETFVPTDGKEVTIQVTDLNGLSNSKTVKLNRSASNTTTAITFESLNPLGRKVARNKDALALIIGVDGYENTPARAIYADTDAKAFADYANEKLGIPTNRIKTLVNDGADESGVLLAVKDWLSRASKKDKTDVYVFFAGHGLASQDGKKMYLLPYDGSPRLLEKTAILRDELFSDIASTNPRSVTVFLDTCYSGETRGNEMLFAGRPIGIRALKQSIPDNFTLMTAAAGDQIANPLKEAKHGMFSYFLMKGMEGVADTNQDNKITALELHEYVKENVWQQSSNKQLPELQGDSNRVLVQFQ